jgi:LPXTG-site transpeptidase (sortase) family protein
MLARHSDKFGQIILRKVIFTVALALFSFVIIFASSIMFKGEAQSNSVPFGMNAMAIEKQVIKIGLPIRLIIPVINVDAAIAYTGLTADGAMDIKGDPTQVAWYELGPRPGENGSAVIAGHYGWTASGEAAVFNNLHNLNKGDEIIVIDDKGISITFTVRESRRYDPDADASSIFKSDDSKSHLNLITCDGVWINSKNTYSNRLVIFTDKK